VGFRPPQSARTRALWWNRDITRGRESAHLVREPELRGLPRVNANCERFLRADPCAVPGFNDAHVHFPSWPVAQREIRLDGAGLLCEAVKCASPRQYTKREGVGCRLA
jgi:hypothetical protein